MTEIRDAVRGDVSAIVAIERRSFSDAWTAAMFASHLEPHSGNTFLVAEDDGELIGYSVARTVAEEAELMNIAVSPGRRRGGIGAMLLDATLARCRAAGAVEMWLEVRASNGDARALYELRGFSEAGVRKRYYHSPREDALVLRADLRAASRNDTERYGKTSRAELER